MENKPYALASPDIGQNGVQISQVNQYRDRPSVVQAKKKARLDPINAGASHGSSNVSAPQGPGEANALSPSGKMKSQKVRTSLLQQQTSSEAVLAPEATNVP